MSVVNDDGLLTMDFLNVVVAVMNERTRQDKQWGDQSHLPDGTGPGALWYGSNFYREMGDQQATVTAQVAQDRCDDAARRGCLKWIDILIEEVAEAFAEDDPGKLRAELVQVAAVAMQWIEAIDTRGDRR